MNLHEYQAKQLLAEYGLPVSKGQVAASVEEALTIVDHMQTPKYVVKAQVHAGGRGKAGGVKLVSTKEEVKELTRKLLHSRLVTYQTTAEGQPVNEVLIEEPCDIAKELYLGAVIDRSLRRVVFMASTEGGVEIEKVAEESPEKILTVTMDPMVGIMPYQGRDLGFALGLNDNQIKQFVSMLVNFGKMMVECDSVCWRSILW